MWNPLKKQLEIPTPTPAQPCLTAAEDNELCIAVKRIKCVENTIKQMDKEMKKYLETIQRLDSVDQSLIKNLSSSRLIQINDEFKKIVENYLSVTVEVGKTVNEIVECCHKTFIEPIYRLRDIFGDIKKALIRREELVSNWKKANSDLKKSQEKKEKTAAHHVKLEKDRKAEELASKDLKIYHAKLLNDLPKFLEKRLEYLQPSIHAFIFIQLIYYTNSTKLFTQLMPNSDSSNSPSSSMISEPDYEQTIINHLDRIKNLTIIKND